MLSSQALLLLFHYFVVAGAIAISPNNPLTILNSTLLDELPSTSLFSLLNSSSSSPNNPFQQWHITGTPTSIRIALLGGDIPKVDLGNTILNTQVTLRTYIQSHYKGGETPIAITTDDPYKSSPRLKNCFVGISTYPEGNKFLTYGVVANVLQGLWDYLYKGGRFKEACFEVQDDVHGTVGVGRVTRNLPGPEDVTEA